MVVNSLGTEPSAGVEPLSTSQIEALAQGARLRRSIARGAKLARLDGVMLAVCGGLCVLSSLFDAALWPLTLVLCGAAYVELRAAKDLARLGSAATRVLAFNQLALVAAIWIYSIVRIVAAYHDDNPLADSLQQSPELEGLLGDTQSMGSVFRAATVGFYGVVMFASLLMQGALAFYYWTRRAPMERYRTQVPTWVQRVLERMEA
jgi:hypothetical protein